MKWYTDVNKDVVFTALCHGKREEARLSALDFIDGLRIIDAVAFAEEAGRK